MQEAKLDVPQAFMNLPMPQPPFRIYAHCATSCPALPFTARSSISLPELQTSMVSGKPAAAAVGIQQPEEPDHTRVLEVWSGHGSARRRNRLLHPLLQHRRSRPELHHRRVLSRKSRLHLPAERGHTGDLCHRPLLDLALPHLRLPVLLAGLPL